MATRPNVGIYVGVSQETVAEARRAITDILGAEVDTAVQLEALQTLRVLFPSGAMVSHNTVKMDTA